MKFRLGKHYKSDVLQKISKYKTFENSKNHLAILSNNRTFSRVRSRPDTAPTPFSPPPKIFAPKKFPELKSIPQNRRNRVTWEVKKRMERRFRSKNWAAAVRPWCEFIHSILISKPIELYIRLCRIKIQSFAALPQNENICIKCYTSLMKLNHSAFMQFLFRLCRDCFCTCSSATK